ncbi:hypothetical protein N7461_000902 [Penicillium sp. DV-2018c]|nr:hypothetical protein N7461_000902 [Penicillium sp. DV-2018c]
MCTVTVYVAYDWTTHLGTRESFSSSFWKNWRAENSAALAVSSAALSSSRLPEYEAVPALQSRRRPLVTTTAGYGPKGTTLRRPAGTGKSHVVNIVSSLLQDLTNEAGITAAPTLRAAPTGVAAHAISGFTLHHPFLSVCCTDGQQSTKTYRRQK